MLLEAYGSRGLATKGIKQSSHENGEITLGLPRASLIKQSSHENGAITPIETYVARGLRPSRIVAKGIKQSSYENGEIMLVGTYAARGLR